MTHEELTSFVFEWSGQPDGANTLVIDASGRAVFFTLWHDMKEGTAEEFSVPPRLLEELSEHIRVAVAVPPRHEAITNRIEDEIFLRMQLWTSSGYFRADCGEDCPNQTKNLEVFLRERILAIPRKPVASVSHEGYPKVWSLLYSYDFSAKKPPPRIDDVLSFVLKASS